MSAIPVLRGFDTWDAWHSAVVRYVHNQRVKRFLSVTLKLDEHNDPYYRETNPVCPDDDTVTPAQLSLWQ